MKRRGCVYFVFVTCLGAVLAVVLLGVLTAGEPPIYDGLELRMLHVVYRHGARTPADTYPKDPYINFTFSPMGWGQLTNGGKRYMYEFGLYLRDHYGAFLGDKYDPKEFYAQSTDVDRSIMSTQLISAGLWPPKKEQKWSKLDWQPVPVHAEPLDADSLLLVRRPCAKYSQEQSRVLQLPEVRKILDEAKPMMEELTKLTGLEIETPDDVQSLYSTLKAEKKFNLTLPPWTKNYYPDRLLPLTIYSYVLNAYNDKMNRLKGGVLLKKLLDDWQLRSAHASSRKAVLYGGHDSTVVNLLSALGVWEPQEPDYGIAAVLELLQDPADGRFGVRVFLRNSTAPPVGLVVPGCERFCPLAKLVELTEPVVPLNWEEECKSDDPNYTPPPPKGP